MIKTRLTLLIVPFSTVSLAACAPGPTSNSEYIDTGIVHGKLATERDATEHSVVALVAQLPNGDALCTGSILDEETILTAAHCVDNQPSKITIVFSSRVQGTTPEHRRIADSYIQNPRWKHPSEIGQGDLALVHFQGGLASGYRPVHLLGDSSASDLTKGTTVLMFGYGVSNGLERSGSGVLRQTETVVIGMASPTEIISDGRKTSVCFGDSGGPAFVTTGKSALQWGVASSVLNSTCTEASIHTDVRPYLNWLTGAARRLRGQSGSPRSRPAEFAATDPSEG